MSSELAIDVANWALSLERAKALAASENIANKNINNVHKSVDFNALINELSSAIDSKNPAAINNVIANDITTTDTLLNNKTTAQSLDAQIADLSAASGRYQTIAKAVSGKFNLMSVAVKGR